MKRCTKCLLFKPLDEFYEHPHPADKRSGKCKRCHNAACNERKKSRRAERRRKVDLSAPKWCQRCDEFKPLEEFYKQKDTLDGRGTYCKTCHNARRVELNSDRISVEAFYAAKRLEMAYRETE